MKKPIDELPKLLSDEQAQKLMLSVLGNYPNGLHQEILLKKAQRVFEWAECALMDHALLQLIAEGKLTVDVDEENEISFKKL